MQFRKQGAAISAVACFGILVLVAGAIYLVKDRAQVRATGGGSVELTQGAPSSNLEAPGAGQTTIASTDVAEGASSVEARRSHALAGLRAGSSRPRTATVSSPTGADLITWQLSEPRIISKGTELRMPQGRMLQGRIIQAKARGVVDGTTVERMFWVTLGCFTPSDDAPAGTQPGRHYLSGNWRLYPVRDRAGRRSLAAVSGTMTTALNMDPIEHQSQAFTATLDVLGTPVSGTRTARRGTYEGSVLFEGVVQLPRGHDLKALAFQMTGEKR